MTTQLFAIKTTANREDQVMDFIESNVKKKGLNIYSISSPPGMRGYIFIEADSIDDVKQSFFQVPYARGMLNKPVKYEEIEPMLEQASTQMVIKEKDIVEIIQGPFKREKAKVKRVDEAKDEVVVELIEAAIPIPTTVPRDYVKVIRRESEEEEKKEEE